MNNYFDIKILKSSDNLHNFQPPHKQDMLHLLLMEKLGKQEDGHCIGSVTTPETYIKYHVYHYYNIDQPDLSPRLTSRDIFAKDYTFTYFDPLIHQFFNKIRIGDDLEELLIKSLFLFKHSYQEEEMREVLHPDLPILPYEIKVIEGYTGHPLFANEWQKVDIESFCPSTKEFDLVLRLEFSFANQVTKYAYVTATTLGKIQERYDQYFERTNQFAVYGYGHMIVSDYDLEAINQELALYQRHIKGNSPEEILIRLSRYLDIENLDEYLYDPLVKSEQTYTLRNKSVAYYEYHQSNDA